MYVLVKTNNSKVDNQSHKMKKRSYPSIFLLGWHITNLFSVI